MFGNIFVEVILVDFFNLVEECGREGGVGVDTAIDVAETSHSGVL